MPDERDLSSYLYRRSAPSNAYLYLQVVLVHGLMTSLWCLFLTHDRYYHRLLKVPKLVDVGFTHVPKGSTVARMVRLNKLASTPKLAEGGGLREMEEHDLQDVAELYIRYMKRFTMIPLMSLDEMRHQFLSGLGEFGTPSDEWKGRRAKQVVWSYVVEVSSQCPYIDLRTNPALRKRRTQRHTKSPTSSLSTLFPPQL